MGFYGVKGILKLRVYPIEHSMTVSGIVYVFLGLVVLQDRRIKNYLCCVTQGKYRNRKNYFIFVGTVLVPCLGTINKQIKME